MALSSLISKYFEEVVEYFNEIKCAIFFISHKVCVIFYIAHLGVRYEIYTLAFPFDLRCQSGIYANIDANIECDVITACIH